MRCETFIVSDPGAVTVSDMIRRFRKSLGREVWLIPAPKPLLKLCFYASRLSGTWEVLDRRLVAPPSKLLAFGWSPLQGSAGVLSALSKGVPVDSLPS
jgi:hypothetical protein